MRKHQTINKASEMLDVHSSYFGGLRNNLLQKSGKGEVSPEDFRVIAAFLASERPHSRKDKMWQARRILRDKFDATDDEVAQKGGWNGYFWFYLSSYWNGLIPNEVVKHCPADSTPVEPDADLFTPIDEDEDKWDEDIIIESMSRTLENMLSLQAKVNERLETIEEALTKILEADRKIEQLRKVRDVLATIE